MKHQTPASSRRVDSVRQAAELDRALLEGFEKVDQISDGPTDPIQFPDNNNIILAKLVYHSAKFRPVGFRTAGFFLKDNFTALF